jgi:hypothetical protein
VVVLVGMGHAVVMSHFFLFVGLGLLHTRGFYFGRPVYVVGVGAGRVVLVF